MSWAARDIERGVRGRSRRIAGKSRRFAGDLAGAWAGPPRAVPAVAGVRSHRCPLVLGAWSIFRRNREVRKHYPGEARGAARSLGVGERAGASFRPVRASCPTSTYSFSRASDDFLTGKGAIGHLTSLYTSGLLAGVVVPGSSGASWAASYKHLLILRAADDFGILWGRWPAYTSRGRRVGLRPFPASRGLGGPPPLARWGARLRGTCPKIRRSPTFLRPAPFSEMIGGVRDD